MASPSANEANDANGANNGAYVDNSAQPITNKLVLFVQDEDVEYQIISELTTNVIQQGDMALGRAIH
eukprot:1795022-Karenia_brevis.AAC.1